MQQNIDMMGDNGCQNLIQRPKNIENDHTHQLCISKFFFVTQCYWSGKSKKHLKSSFVPSTYDELTKVKEVQNCQY